MIKDLVVIGAGNPDIVKLIEDINSEKKVYNFLGFLEKDSSLHAKNINGYEVIGDDGMLNELKNCAVVNNVLASLKIRENITNILKQKYYINNFPSLVHPSNYTRYVSIGEGNILYENLGLGANSTIGNFNILYYGSVLGHESIIGNNNLIAAGSTIAARTKLEDRIFVSNGTTINLNISIVSDVFLGIGSTVIKSISKPGKYFGYPAKEMSMRNLRDFLG